MKLPNLTPSSSDIITEGASEVSSSGIKTITVFVDETDKISPYNDTYKNEDEVIHAIEKVVRTSYEYRQYVAICKTEFDLTKCKFIPQADIVDTNVGLELHHYPFTLFDIVQGVLRHEYGILSDREPVYKRPVNLFKVAEKVMKLHYQGVIGLIPLSLTAHELAHNGDIFIPLTDEYVFGNWKSLFDNQEEYGIELAETVNFNVRQAIDMTNKMIEEGTEVDLSVLEPIKTKVVHETFSDKPNYIVTDEIGLA